MRLSLLKLSALTVCALCIPDQRASADQGIRVRQLEATVAGPVEFLTERLAVPKGHVWGESAVELDIHGGPDRQTSGKTVLADGAIPHFTWDNRFAGYWTSAADGAQKITCTDADAKPIWQIDLPAYQPYEMLGTAGIALLPPGSNEVEYPPVEIEFRDATGAKIGNYAQPGSKILLRRVTPAGDIALVVGDRNGDGTNEFVRLSNSGRLITKVALEDVSGPGSTIGLDLSQTHAAFVAFKGTQGQPVLSPTDRLLYIISNAGETIVEEIGTKCGTYTVWLDESRLALLGSGWIRVWDLSRRAWTLPDTPVPGQTFLAEAQLVDGSLITLSRVRGRAVVVSVNLDNGRVLQKPLPKGVEFDQRRRTLYRDPAGVLVVTRQSQFLVENEPSN